jgi:tetratricopeptide (TPR) repeat protein
MPYRMTTLRAFTVVLTCAGATCLPFLVDSEMRNVELRMVDYARMTGPALRGGIVIRTPFRTTDPYIEYVNQLTSIIPPISEREVLRIYSGRRALTVQETSAVQQALQRSRAVLDLMPFDDGAWENVSRLYLFAGQKDSALDAATRALALRPSDYSHLVNLGLLREGLGMKNDAVFLYARALAIYPRLIESPFWQELTEQDEVSAHEIIATAIRNEERSYNATGDVIDSERLARLLWASGDLSRSGQILAAIVGASPGLEGAWELNGEISRDRNAAILCYKRAMFLDPSDPLPHARLGDLALAAQDVSSAATEWVTAWMLYRKMRTPHSEIAKVRYRLPNDIANDAIPGTWIYYISPTFGFSSAFSEISARYEASGQIQDAKAYKQLAVISGRQVSLVRGDR